MLHTIHTIMSPTALNSDAGRHPLPANTFVDPPRVLFAENIPVAQSPVLQQDNEDDDLVWVLAIPMTGDTQTPIRRRASKAIQPEETVASAALGKRVWNATKGVFKNKNKKIPVVCNDDDDDDNDDASFVIVFQTPDRPTRLTCPPPPAQRETRKAEICNTESVLQIVRPDDQEETRNQYAVWVQKRNARGNVFHTPLRPRSSTSPPRGRHVARIVKLGDPAVVEEMRMAARGVAKRLQTV